jgi:hypothetical protein
MATSHPAANPPVERQDEIRIVSHSNLFYWWPVWAIGFIMAAITLLVNPHYMAIVPSGTHVATIPDNANVKVEIDGKSQDIAGRQVLVPPKGSKELTEPRVRTSANKNLGVTFVIVLLLVITITNVPLRGLWSVIVIVVIIFLMIIFSLAGWWETIVDVVGALDIHINLAGYLVISVVLLAIWLITLLLFDQQIYMVFTPGQVRVRLEIGEGETAYDTTGMTVQKQRSDLFRHWILGLGSGDLIVTTSGAQAHHFDLPNVLFVGRKVKQIEAMLRARPVVRGGA